MKRNLTSAFLSLLATVALATPPNSPILDGRPTDYDSGELRGTYTGGGGTFGAGVSITNLFVTWDSNYVYFALQGTEVNDKLVVMVDVDPTNGTGATSTTNWTGVTPDYIRYNDVGWRKSDDLSAVPFGLDLMIASEGFYNNIDQIFYDGETTPTSNNVISLFDHGNGNSPVGAPVDMAVQSDITANDLKGFEARIPWSVVFASNHFGIIESGEIVPRGATLRVFANIHNNDPSSAFSASDTIPQQVSANASYAAGLLVTDSYIDIPVDGNGDGIPDLVGGGDVNAPFIQYLQGAQGKRDLYAQFNEPLNGSTATTIANWSVGGNTPGSAVMTQTNAVLLHLTNDLPGDATLVKVTATGVEDTSSNTKVTYNYLSANAGGLSTSITVRFILETASGLGLNPGASSFYINGSGLPLEFGYPPAMSSPLGVYSGSQYYRDVTFPPGTPLVVNYKYSGVLTSTGTNTYEAIRLVDYASAARRLTLDTNATLMVVTDYLGAAAAPYRDPNVVSGYNGLYIDGQRGDAGVRERTTVLFQLDLRNYSLSGVSNIAVKGSDPLRGFNADNTGIADFNFGGIALVDDGTRGDTNANDGIFSRQWVFSPDGTDDVAEPGFPYSLVGGDFSTSPYFGSGWVDGRSPKSVIYKFYLMKGGELESQGGNQEYYIEGSPTNIVLPVFGWNNNALPPPPPSNSPAMRGFVVTSGVVRVLFTNLVSESQHGVQVATNLLAPWLDYGTRAAGSGGNWTGLVADIGNRSEIYRAFSGPAQPFRGVRFDPDPLPATGGTMRVFYTQHSRGLAGDRNVQIAGTFTGWGPQPMTFMGDGTWYYDALISEAVATNIEFKPRNLSGTQWEGMGGGGENYRAYKGYGRATWTPNSPTNQELFTITYNAAGGPLAAATNVNAYYGFEEQWFDAGNHTMTNIGGSVWEIAFPVPTNRSLSVNFVFNGQTNGSATVFWDSESTAGGRANRAFIKSP